MRRLVPMAIAPSALLLALCMTLLSNGCLPKPYEIGAPDPSLAVYYLAWQQVDQHYGSFLLRPDVDWDRTCEDHRAAAEAAGTPEELIGAIDQMLGVLGDIGLIVYDSTGTAWPSFDPGRFVNFDEAIWVTYLEAWDITDSFMFYDAGPLPPPLDSIGYAYVATLGPDYDMADFYSHLNSIQDCSGLILDLRMCGEGGLEVNARSAVGRFVEDGATAYYRTDRNGPGRTDMSDTVEVQACKNGSWQFMEPVLVLTGRGTSGAAEVLALLLATQEHVTMVGDTTAGFASTSETWSLSGGWSLAVPTSLVFDPAMVPVFDRGLQPEINLQVTAEEFVDSDPVLDAAVEMLIR